MEAAKQSGGKIDVMAWNPGSEYRTDLFYFYMVSTNRSGPPVLLDNGLIGYFGVYKKPVRCTNSLLRS